MQLGNYKILIVDDHSLLRQMINTILKDHGATSVDATHDGTIGIEKIKNAAAEGTPYHMVFLDWSMPGMNGYDVLKMCRADKQMDGTAFIMLTAESEDVNIVKALDAGATAYITKPFTPDKLISKFDHISKWLSQRAEI